MQIMTKDAMIVVPNGLLRAAEIDNPDLEAMKLLVDIGKVSLDDYWAALKPTLDKLAK